MKKLFQKLDQILQLLLEEKEERKAEKEAKQRTENERMLVEYAQKHGKRVPADFMNSRDAGNAPVRSDGDLVPYGLSEREKAILQLFYDS